MVLSHYRKIFPPSPEELPAPPQDTSTKEPQEEVEGSGVLVQEGEATEPAAKKANTESQEPGKDDWDLLKGQQMQLHWRNRRR